MTDLIALQDLTQRHHHHNHVTSGNTDTGELESVRINTPEAGLTGEATQSDETPPELYDFEARGRRKTVIVGTLIVAIVLFSFIILFIVTGKPDQ